MEEKTCPICGSKKMKYPALSRYDNKTDVCSDCGVVEAFNTPIILVCRKVNLSFANYAGHMAEKGYANPFAQMLLKVSKDAKVVFGKNKKPRR